MCVFTELILWFKEMIMQPTDMKQVMVVSLILFLSSVTWFLIRVKIINFK